MKITQQCVVALTWKLTDTQGELLHLLDDPVEFLVGGDDLLGKIEQALEGHEPADQLDLRLEPEEAFGDYDSQLVFMEPRELFPPLVQEGMCFDALPAGTNPQAPPHLTYTVTEIYPSHLVLDGNHPLAGIALQLHLKVADVRQATAQEIGRGSTGTGFFKVLPKPAAGSPLH